MNIITSNFLDEISFDYKGGTPPDSGIVSVQAPLISEFMDNIGAGPYILNMTHQDAGIYYNVQENVGNIHVNFCRSDTFVKFIIENYDKPVVLTQSIEYKSENKFLLATYSGIIASFNIPEQVKRIYTNNSYVQDEKIREIPLGAYSPQIMEQKHKNQKSKNGKILVSIEQNTMSRFINKIYLHGYSKKCNSITILHDKVPVDEFYDLISEHSFVFCPYGNGLDTYRLWETLYLGSVPILDHSHQKYIDEFFKVIRLSSLDDYDKILENPFLNNLDKVSHPFLDTDFHKRRIVDDYNTFLN